MDSIYFPGTGWVHLGQEVGREEELVQDLFLRSSAVSSRKEEEEPEEKIETECPERQGEKKRENGFHKSWERELFLEQREGSA